MHDTKTITYDRLPNSPTAAQVKHDMHEWAPVDVHIKY